MRTVTYQGLQFDVPADWPVYDLAADPTTCVRFDVNAVYLGHPGADMACPAGIVGRADRGAGRADRGQRPRRRGHRRRERGRLALNPGLEAQVVDDGAAVSEVAAEVPTAGVSVTLTYLDSDATAQQILQSFRATS